MSNEKNDKLEYKILHGLEKISDLLKNQLWQKSHPLKLSPIQAKILNYLLLNSEKKSTNSKLADELMVTRATITDSLKLLESKDFISSEKDPNDKRSSVFSLTPLGKTVAKETLTYDIELASSITKLEPQSQEKLYSGLVTFIKELQEYDLISAQRICFTCKYYSKNEDQHYCNLLKSELKNTEIQINCPEHEAPQ